MRHPPKVEKSSFGGMGRGIEKGMKGEKEGTEKDREKEEAGPELVRKRGEGEGEGGRKVRGRRESENQRLDHFYSGVVNLVKERRNQISWLSISFTWIQ